MKDEIIHRILDETCQGLKGVEFPTQTPHLVPSYNALLAAARGNHPNDGFLRVLEPLEPGASGPEEMRVLFAQLRIVLESYMGTIGEPETKSGLNRSDTVVEGGQ